MRSHLSVHGHPLAAQAPRVRILTRQWTPPASATGVTDAPLPRRVETDQHR